MDATSFNQQMRVMGKMVEAGDNLVNDIYNAQNQTSNTELNSINSWEYRAPWHSFTIKTPKGRLLKWVLLSNNDTWEHLEFTDVKLWGDPIKIATRMVPENLNLNSKILDNKSNARILAKQYTSWKDNGKVNLRINEENTIDDELDKRYETLKQEYLKLFKEYSQARPDQQWEMASKVAEAIVKYNNLYK